MEKQEKKSQPVQQTQEHTEKKGSEDQRKDKKNRYNKYYKALLILPAIMMLFSLVYLFQFSAQHGDLVLKDISLTGGTTITVFDSGVDINELKNSLRAQFPDLVVRSISDLRTGKQQAFFLETTSSPEEISFFSEANSCPE